MGYTFALPTKLVISADAAVDLVTEIGGLPSGPVLVVTDSGIVDAGLAQPLIDALRQAKREPTVYDEVPGNPTVVDVGQVVAAAHTSPPAAIVAIGGGSVIDTAKAVALLLGHDGLDYEAVQWGRASITRASLPVIAMPTTAGTGSEVTHVAVIGDQAGFKKGVVHPTLFPRTAIVDGALSLSLPPNLTAATGMDALVHAIEAYLGRRANASMDLFALAAMRAVTHWLPAATHHGDNLQARRAMAQAAAWAGMAMDQTGLGLVHALCGPLAAHYHVHHGLGIALLLPAVLAFNAEAVSAQRWPDLRDALELAETATPQALCAWAQEFLRALDLPTTLSEIGVEPSSVETMAQEATRMAMIGNNPREATAADCSRVLEAAL